MKLFDPAKWERVRTQGRRRFIKGFAFWCGFLPGLVTVLFYFWSFWRLQTDLALPTATLWPFLWLCVFFAFIAFPLVGAGCGLLTWHISERLYLGHRAVPP